MEYADFIKTIPLKYRSGTVLSDEGDLQLYILYLFVATAFFFALYEVLRISMEKFKVEAYMSKNGD